MFMLLLQTLADPWLEVAKTGSVVGGFWILLWWYFSRRSPEIEKRFDAAQASYAAERERLEKQRDDDRRHFEVKHDADRERWYTWAEANQSKLIASFDAHMERNSKQIDQLVSATSMKLTEIHEDVKAIKATRSHQ